MTPFAVLLALLALVGCGGSTERAAPAAGAPIPGGGLSIEEATASDLEGPLMVKGFVVDAGAEARLCSALLESYPPQCGRPSLRLEGLAASPDEVQEANGVRWTDSEISLVGEVRDGTLVVSETSR